MHVSIFELWLSLRYINFLWKKKKLDVVIVRVSANEKWIKQFHSGAYGLGRISYGGK